MAKSRSLEFGGVKLSAGGEATPSARPEPDTPFRILILGNFSGRTTGETSRLADGPLVQVDRDNFEEVLARFGVRVHVPAVGEDIALSELDDFHPDRLFQQLKVFEALRGLRRRLSNPATFAAAAAEVSGWAPDKSAAPPKAQEPPAVPTAMAPADLLDEMLAGSASSSVDVSSSSEPDWSALVAQIIQPYVLPRTDPQQPELIAQVDEATGAHLRSVLHHPEFKAIEAAWRAVYFLVRRLETDSNLKVYLLDVSREEAAADLTSATSERTSALHKILVEQTVHTPGGQPWALIVGNYTFTSSPEDILLLLRLGRIARQAGAPFLVAGHSSTFGCASLDQTPDADDWQAPAATVGREAWETLRRLPEAAYLGLPVPRFLLRLPYGKSTGGAEKFAFEEFPAAAPHELLLWGNPAFACALLLGQAFSREGWDMRPGGIDEIDSLPAYSYREDDESQLKPCAEVVLTDRAVERIRDAGLIPLRSVQGSDVVRVAGFQSLASSGAQLAGRWQ